MAHSFVSSALLAFLGFSGVTGFAPTTWAQTTSPSSSACPIATPFPNNIVEVHIATGAMSKGQNAFGTNPLSVPVNSVVIWVNDDSIAHTVTSDDGKVDSGSIQPGKAFAFTFDSPQVFAYHCSIHPSMTGTINVGNAAATAPAATPTVQPAPQPSCPNVDSDGDGDTCFDLDGDGR